MTLTGIQAQDTAPVVITPQPEDVRMYFLVRTDLGMGKGKIAAQVAHAAMRLGIRCQEHQPDVLHQYLDSGERKIVLKTNDVQDLVNVFQDLVDHDFPATIIEDAGHTQIEAGTMTVLGVGPARAADLEEFLGHFKLL